MGLGAKVKELHMRHVPGSSVSFELAPGEIIGLTGGNGAGKTELLRYLAGLLRTGTMGEIVMDGLDPFHARDLEKLNGRIGMVFQAPEETMVFSRLASDAAFGPENRAVEPEIIRKRWEGLRSRLLADVPEDRTFSELSGGQQQRAALVSVLMLRADLLLLDEALSMQGKDEGREVLSLVLSLAKRNEQTVILVSHDPEVLRRTDRVLVLKDGKAVERKAAYYDQMYDDTEDTSAEASADAATERLDGQGTEKESRISIFGQARRGPSWIVKKEPDTTEPLITLRDVSFRYGKNTVVEHFTAEICPGGIYRMVGDTGEGKSTLCRLMNGTLHHNTGQIRVDGRELPTAGRKLRWSPIAGRRPKPLAPVRRFAGYAMQSPEDQLFEVNVRLDVMYGPLKAGRTTAMARKDAEDALRQLHIPEKLWDRDPEKLSGGEKRLVAIAGILAMKPRVLILDEPFAGLDKAGRKVLEEVIEDYAGRGNAVVLTAHE